MTVPRVEKLFKRVNQGRMYQGIVDQVFESIVGGELKASEKLPSEKELGKIFGVSRVTVREAIRSLEQSGVIEVRQGSSGGAFVKEIKLESIAGQMKNALRMANLNFDQLATARAFLEEIILLKFDSWDSRERRLSELRDSVDRAERLFKEGQAHLRSEANADFHRKIAQMTGNPIMVLMHELISDMLVGFFKKANPSDAITARTLKDHREIIRLLEEEKYPEAARKCAEHLKSSTRMIAKNYRSRSVFGRKMRPGVVASGC